MAALFLLSVSGTGNLGSSFSLIPYIQSGIRSHSVLFLRSPSICSFLYPAICRYISSNPHSNSALICCLNYEKHHPKSDNCKHLHWLMPLTGSSFPTFSTWLLEVSALIHVLREISLDSFHQPLSFSSCLHCASKAHHV